MRVGGSEGEKGGERKREREEGRDNEEGEGGDGEIQQGMSQTRFIIPCTGPWRYSRDLPEGLVHLCKGISSLNNHHTICDCVYCKLCGMRLAWE